MTERGFKARVIMIVLVMLALWVGLTAKLFALHLGPNEELRAFIKNVRMIEEDLVVGRGRILDRGGNVLALDRAVSHVCVDPETILKNESSEAVTRLLARALNRPDAEVRDRVERPGRRFEYVAKYVDGEIVDRIKGMRLEGVFFEDASGRFYPQASLMSHVIGFSNHEGMGSAGVEQRWQRYLKGVPGLRVSERDGWKRALYTHRLLDVEPTDGADLVLTLDQHLQYILEQALAEAVEKHAAKGGWAAIQRVRTGEILAMATVPTYDLNAFSKAPDAHRMNRFIGYVFEPGSTFKVAVIAAALNEGLVSPDELFDCENGRWFYGDKPLNDYHAYGMLSLADVLKKSSNIGAAKVALKLGNERLYAYLKAFGFGSLSGVDLPGEGAGILHPVRRWGVLSPTRIAMGHEVGVTALQMLNMLSCVANRGFLMRPRVVSKVVDKEGRTIVETEPQVIARPIREETAQTMCEMLARVTEDGGTGRRARIAGYRVAGKTGTAEKPGVGGYSKGANVASFMGFLPAEDPELAIMVVVDEPQPEHTGGTVAAPVFAAVAASAVRYLDIPPTETVMLTDQSTTPP